MKRLGVALAMILGSGACRTLQSPPQEQLRYVRLTARGALPECSFGIDRQSSGWTITSVTGTLTVVARYDASDRLLDASAALQTGPAARAQVSAGRVSILRPGREAQDFDAPPGLIVTSAPDWSDALRICRLWNRASPGLQKFPGLWIHPEQPAQRLTFSAERTGGDALGIGDQAVALDRLSIRLRGNSAYAAWIDPAGRMIKLMSLPPRDGSAVLALEGFEGPAAALRPE